MPIQVLPNRNRSFADSILSGMAEAAQETGRAMPGVHKEHLAQKEKNLSKQSMKEYGKQFNIPGFENLDPSIQRAIVQNSFKTPKAKEPIGFSDTYSYLEKIYDKQFVQQLGAEKMNEITKLAQQYSLEMSHDDAVYKASQEVIKGKKGGSFADQITGKQQEPHEKQMAEQFANASPEEQDGIMSSVQKGIQSSVMGRLSAIQQGIPYSQYQKQNELNNDSFLNRQVKSFARMLIGNAPLFLTGGYMGAQGGAMAGAPAGPFGSMAGGLMGGGAGAVALPEMLDTALEEYHKYLEHGGDKPFDAFIEGAGKTLKTGIESGIEGATFSILGRIMPMLKQVPQLEGLFQTPYVGKFAEQATKGAFEAGGILAQKTATHQKLPSKEEIADTFTQVIGFNVFGGLTENAQETISKLVQKSGKSPDFVASELADRISKGDIKDQKDVIKSVKDITSEHFDNQKMNPQDAIELDNAQSDLNALKYELKENKKKNGEKAYSNKGIEERIKEQESKIDKLKNKENEAPRERGFNLKTESTPEREVARGVFDVLSNIKIEEPGKTAAMLAERPMEEALAYEKRSEEKKNKPLTEKEQAKRQVAQDKVDKIDEKIARAKDDIAYLEEKAKTGTAEQKSLSKAGIKGKQNELETLEKERAKFESVSKKGVEPFSKEALNEPIQKHMDELEAAAKDPESVSAHEWKQMFARDQKYVNEFAKILEKGELPESAFKDRFIKTLEAYQEAYRHNIDRVRERLDAVNKQYEGMNKRSKEARALRNEREHLNRKLKLLEDNIKINEAKIGLQKEKLASLYELKKPPAALTKQILKNMRKDLVDLQHDFIKQKHELDALEKKTESKAKEAIKENNRLLKEYAERPTKENLDRLAEAHNIPKEVIHEALEQARAKAKDVAEPLISSIEKPTSSKKLRPIGESKADRKAKDQMTAKIALREAEKAANDLFKRLEVKLKKLPKEALMVIAFSEIQSAIEDMTGYKPPFNIISLFTKGSLPQLAVRSAVATLYKKVKNHFSMSADKKIYNELRSPQAQFEFRKKLEDKYTRDEIKEIIF